MFEREWYDSLDSRIYFKWPRGPRLVLVLQFPLPTFTKRIHTRLPKCNRLKSKKMQLISRQVFCHLISTFILGPVFLGSVHALQSLPLPVQVVSNIGLGVWIENIAVRVSGPILGVGLTPNLFQVNPLGDTKAVIVHTFPSPVTALLGLTEVTPDVFYVAAGNVTNTTVQVTPNTLSVWQVVMAGFTTQNGLSTPIRKIADFPDAGILDSMTTLNAAQGLVLIGDNYKGQVWLLNVYTGAKSVLLNMADMAPVAGDIPFIGINGIKYVNGNLYFTNTDQQLFVRLPLSTSGVVTGSAVVVNSAFGRPDDFTLDGVNNAFVALNSNSIGLLQPNGKATVLAGGSTSTALPGVTGAKFGRTATDSKVLYMGTTGGSYIYATTRNFTVPGGISKIDIGGAGYFNYLG